MQGLSFYFIVVCFELIDFHSLKNKKKTIPSFAIQTWTKFFLVSLKFIDYSASTIIVVLSNPSVGSLLDLRYLSLHYQRGQRNYYQLLLLNPPLLDNENQLLKIILGPRLVPNAAGLMLSTNNSLDFCSKTASLPLDILKYLKVSWNTK